MYINNYFFFLKFLRNALQPSQHKEKLQINVAPEILYRYRLLVVRKNIISNDDAVMF